MTPPAHCERAGSGHCRHCRRAVPDAFGPIDCPARLRAALDAVEAARHDPTADLAARLRALDEDELRAVLANAKIAAGWRHGLLWSLALPDPMRVGAIGEVTRLTPTNHQAIYRSHGLESHLGGLPDHPAARRAVEDAAIADGWRVPWRDE